MNHLPRKKYEEAIETGKRIRLARIENDYSMEQLGERLTPPASKGAVSNWENGYNLPNDDRVTQLCDVLDISRNFLLNGEYMARDIHIMPPKERRKFFASIDERINKTTDNYIKELKLLIYSLDIAEMSLAEINFLIQSFYFMYNSTKTDKSEALISLIATLRQLNEMYNQYIDEELTNDQKIKNLKWYKEDLEKEIPIWLNEMYEHFISRLN